MTIDKSYPCKQTISKVQPIREHVAQYHKQTKHVFRCWHRGLQRQQARVYVDASVSRRRASPSCGVCVSCSFSSGGRGPPHLARWAAASPTCSASPAVSARLPPLSPAMRPRGPALIVRGPAGPCGGWRRCRPRGALAPRSLAAQSGWPCRRTPGAAAPPSAAPGLPSSCAPLRRPGGGDERCEGRCCAVVTRFSPVAYTAWPLTSICFNGSRSACRALWMACRSKLLPLAEASPGRFSYHGLSPLRS